MAQPLIVSPLDFALQKIKAQSFLEARRTLQTMLDDYYNEGFRTAEYQYNPKV